MTIYAVFINIFFFFYFIFILSENENNNCSVLIKFFMVELNFIYDALDLLKLFGQGLIVAAYIFFFSHRRLSQYMCINKYIVMLFIPQYKHRVALCEK